MLARQFRLPSSVVLNNSQSIREDEFLAKYQKNIVGHNRYGFVIAKTIDKRAVARNRLRRVFRSCIEEKWLGQKESYDILFVLKPSARNATREVLQAKVDMVMAKIS